jgi:protein TonB
MFRIDYRLRLALAVALSLSLHLLPFINPQPPESAQKTASTPIEAQLRPPLPLPEQAALSLPKEEPRPAIPATPAPSKPKFARPGAQPTASWQTEVRRQLKNQHERGLFYPAEAIVQGLEGEALVLLILNSNGQVSAARIEESSGHRQLDAAALRAVRALHGIPADAPRETLLPVRFRLK